MDKTLDSNNSESKIYDVCDKCGTEASRLTCIKRYGKEPLKVKFDVSTYHRGVCDFCGKYDLITEVRDFYYPDFGLLSNSKVEE